MSIKWIDHIVIGVKNLEDSIVTFRDKLGLSLMAERENPALGIKSAHFKLPDERVLELAEPLGPDTPLGRAMERRGEGIHILALAVDNLEKAVEEYRSKGLQMIVDDATKQAFIHPRSSNGVLLQLIEDPSDSKLSK